MSLGKEIDFSLLKFIHECFEIEFEVVDIFDRDILYSEAYFHDNDVKVEVSYYEYIIDALSSFLLHLHQSFTEKRVIRSSLFSHGIGYYLSLKDAYIVSIPLQKPLKRIDLCVNKAEPRIKTGADSRQ